jgi:hypothetical protein
MTINGLKLPDDFVALIDRPKPLIHWDPKEGNLAWTYKGGEGNRYWVPNSDSESDDWLDSLQLFESLSEVEEETNNLPVTFHVAEYTPEEIEEGNARYAHLPGFLPFITDFSKIVYFGNTASREAFCFDYRENAGEPSIIHWDDAYWRRFAPDFSSFMSLFEESDLRRLELDDQF